LPERQPVAGEELSKEDVRSALELTIMQLTVRWPVIQATSAGRKMRMLIALLVIDLLMLPVRALHPMRARCATTAAPG
jgi:hypothetical protein